MTRKAPLDIDAGPHISSILGAGMSRHVDSYSEDHIKYLIIHTKIPLISPPPNTISNARNQTEIGFIQVLAGLRVALSAHNGKRSANP